jgi:hypothetical protein
MIRERGIVFFVGIDIDINHIWTPLQPLHLPSGPPMMNLLTVATLMSYAIQAI